MTILRTRRRLVNFRLTDEELASLKVACLIEGARNVSDFARKAVLQSARGRLYPESSTPEMLVALERRLARIELALGAWASAAEKNSGGGLE